jgi:SAM-dependent methyltransferase
MERSKNELKVIPLRRYNNLNRKGDLHEVHSIRGHYQREGDYTLTLPETEENILFNENPIISKWVTEMYEQTETETDDVDFLLSLIGKNPKRILEVCCGSGRILVPLAKAGHMVSGLDADEFMLAKIPAKVKGLENIQWRKADAVHDNWGTGFDVVVLAGNILYNIVSDMDYAKAQELFIQKAASALVPGGCVYIEYQPGGHSLIRPENVNSGSGDCIIWDGIDNDGNRGRMTLFAGKYDAETQIDSFVRSFELTLKNGEMIKQDIPCQKHFATLDQIRGWLSSTGFSIKQEYGDYHRNPIGDNTHRAIIYARKE